MNEYGEGEELGFSSRGRARPVGQPAGGGFAVDLARTNNPVVRDTYAPEIRQQENIAAREAAAAAREQAAQAKEAAAAQTAERKRRLARTEADFRARGVKFYTDAEGEIRPMQDGAGRTLHNETPWRKASDGGGGFWQERRDQYGKPQRRRPKLKPGADPADPNLYYDFGDEGDEVAGHVDDLAGVKDPEAAAVVTKVRARREAELRKASLAPLAQARDAAEAELARTEREAMELNDRAAALQREMAQIDANPEAGKTAGGVFGIGAQPTQAAAQLAAQRAKLQSEHDTIQAKAAELAMAAGPDSELSRRAKAAKLDQQIWQSEAEKRGYDDLAEARRAVLKRDGKPEADDPVLAAISRKQEELGVTRSRSFTERERMRKLGADAEAKAAKEAGPVTPDAVKAAMSKFEADLKAHEAELAAGRGDPARRDELVTRQGTLRGQVARLNAEAVQGQKDFEAFTDGLVKDIEAYQADSERWDWGKGTVSGALARQADRFGKVMDAAEGKGRWVEGVGDTLGFLGGAVGTWTDILTGVSPEGVERKRRAEDAWELVGSFKGADARRALTARVAAEEAIKADPAAQLVAVPSLKEKPFTEAERLRLSSGVIDLATMQRAVNRLRESDGTLGADINVTSEEALRSLSSILNVVPGVNLEKMGAPKDPEGFAAWKVLRGELARLMAEKFGGAETTGAVAGSLLQFGLTRKAAGALTARAAAMAGAAGVGGRLAAVVGNAERNANWLTYGTIGTASSFTENPESLGFFNRFMSAGISSLGIAAGESVGNKLEALVGRVAKVRRGYGNLAAREAAGLVGGTVGEFSSDWIESAVLNQDFTPQVPVAFWGNLGAVVGMRLFGAAGRVRGQRDYNRFFAATAAAAKNEAFNRWADVKAFMATPEGKRVADLMPADLAEGGDMLARKVFASDAEEGRHAEVPDAFKAASRDFGLTLGFGQFIQGVQARAMRTRAAASEIEALPDYAQMDPATGAPIIEPALRGANRDAAAALVRIANGVPAAELTEAQTQGLQVIGAELGSEMLRDVAGTPVITDKASGWLRDQAPAAASLIGASEAEMMQRLRPEATDAAQSTSLPTTERRPRVVAGAEDSPAQVVGGANTREAAGGAGGASVDTGVEAGGSPAPLSPGSVEYTDAGGAVRTVEVPAGAVVPSSREAVRDQRTAARWLAESSREAVRGVRFTPTAPESPASPAPTAAETAETPVESTGELTNRQLATMLRRAVESRKAEGPARERLVNRGMAVRKRLASAISRWAEAFPGGVRVVERTMGSGGVLYDAETDSLVVSLGDLADQVEALTSNSNRVDALVTEEAIHRAAVEVERAGKWDAGELWTLLATATRAKIAQIYDPTGKQKRSDWQMGHELVRMLVQGRMKIGADGAVLIDGETVSEATASAGWLAKLRDALAALAEYLRDLAGGLRADGNDAATIRAVEQAVALVEARLRELSGVRTGSGANVPNSGESRRAAGEMESATPPVPAAQAAEVERPAPGERIGGAREGETGPAARLEVGPDGRLTAASAAALAEELGIKPERVGALEWVTHGGETFWVANIALEAEQANTSHTPDGRVNPDYPQALQPRDRAGAQYLAQQRRIAQRPNPREETLRGTADHGTPIMALVEGEAVTVMGNGRANAKALMYADEDFAEAADRFRRLVPQIGRGKGIAPDAVAALDNPVLARVILTPMGADELRELSQGSNRPAGAATNAVEQGRIDAGRLTVATLALYRPEYRVDARENAPFRAAFARNVLQSGEDNTTEADLVRRIEQAVFLRAYGGTPEGAAAFARLTGEASDAGVRNLVDAMMELAPEVSVARAKMEQGALHPLDLSREIAAAVQRIGVALRDKPRDQAVDVAMDGLVSQGSLFGGDTGTEVLAFFVENRRDKARLLQGVRDFYALAYAAGSPAQGTLFDEAPPTVAELWRQATEGAGVLRSAPGQVPTFLSESLRTAASFQKFFTQTATEILAEAGGGGGPAAEATREQALLLDRMMLQTGPVLGPFMNRYAQAMPEFNAAAADIGAEAGLPAGKSGPSMDERFYVRSSLKKARRILEKALFEEGVIRDLSRLPAVFGEMKDILGVTYVVGGQDRINLLRSLSQTRLAEVRHNSKLFLPPNDPHPGMLGYRDDKVRVQRRDGTWAEVIIIQPHMNRVKNGPGHTAYEVMRTISAMEANGPIPDSLRSLLLTAREFTGRIYREAAALDASLLSAPGQDSNSSRETSRANAAVLPTGVPSGLTTVVNPGRPGVGNEISDASLPSKSVPIQNRAPAGGSNLAEAFINQTDTAEAPARQPKPRITVENIETYRGAVDASELARRGNGAIWKAFNREVFDAADTKRLVPLAKLVSNKDELQDPKFLAGRKPDPRQTAVNAMVWAIDGDPRNTKGPRDPLDVYENGDGTYTIMDGNATAQAAMLAGWRVLPVIVRPRPDALLSAKGQDNSADFFDSLGMGAEADAFARSLPRATRAKPAKVAMETKKAAPKLPPPALKAMVARANRIEQELELWGIVPPAPVAEENAETRLSDSAPPRNETSNEPATSNPRIRDADQRADGGVGAQSGVGNDLGALPLFQSGDAADTGRSGAAEPASRDGGEGDGAASRMESPQRDALSGGDGAVPGRVDRGVSGPLPGDGDGAGRGDAAAAEGGRGAAGGVPDATVVDGGGGEGSLRPGAAAELARAELNAERAVRRDEYSRLPPERRNYRITGDAIAPRGQRAKLTANLEALRLLRRLDTENRDATPAEKDVLARWVGWGGLPQVFDETKAATASPERLEELRASIEQNERFARLYASTYYTQQVERLREELRTAESWAGQYGEAYRELKELLTPEEWDRAMRSTLNAHYTSPTVIRAMWSAMERMGFRGGRVLEPAGGAGHFFGAMPDALMESSRLSGVELDSITGRIFARLYPAAEVQVTGFQDARIPNNSQDLVISNVPFAKTGPADESLDAPNLNLHNYFFAKALQKAKPGGVVAFITTANTMQSAATQRAWLARRSELIGAIRLPNTAFKDSASTEVVTDILFLRKPDGRPPAFEPEAWIDTVKVGEAEVDGTMEDIVVNEYFARHPEMVLGRHSLGGSMYRGNEYTVEPTGDLAAQLREAVDRLPAGILETDPTTEATPIAPLAPTGAKKGNFVERDGRLFVSDGVELKPLESLPDFAPITGNDRKDKGARTKREKLLRRLRAWLPLREHYNRHLALMLDASSSDAAVEASRERLNELYDQARAVDGGKYPLADSVWNPLRHDPDFYRTLGLEVPIPGSKDEYRKADVFTRRTVVPTAAPMRAGSPAEALRVSQAWKGRVDGLYVADLLGMEQGEAEGRLIEEGLAFRDPETGLLEDREGYLSGYVRQKLAAAKIAAAQDPAFARNVAALEAVQPAPVRLGDITVRLGVSWMPDSVVSEFLRSELRIEAEAKATRTGENVRWSLRPRSVRETKTDANTRIWAGGGWSGMELMEAILAGRAIQSFKTEGTGKDKKRVLDATATRQAQDMADRIRKRFDEWAKTPGREIPVRVGEFSQMQPLAEIIERGYNDHFNGFVERVWDGSHLTLPGAAPHVLAPANQGGLRPHQKAAIWRAVTEGRAFFAHAPGFGKTNEFIATAMEWRRLGIAKKPMVVVQNSTLEQFAASWRKMYPGANILVASKSDLSKERRLAFTARVAASDWDAVIVAHSQFTLIPSNPVVESAQLRSLREEMQEALNAREDELKGQALRAREIDNDPSVKDIARQIEAIEKRLAGVSQRKQDDIVDFGEMGIDALLIDEAHYFKKVPFATQMERVAGLDQSSSQRAFDTLVKARGIQDKRDGRGVVLGTGTPITNTLAEVWNMLRLSAPKLLKQFGVEAFDDFIKTFGSVEKSVEMNAVGKFVERMRLKRFVNGAGLAQFIRAGMDVQMDASKVQLSRPNVEVEPAVVPQSPAVGAYIENLVRIYQNWTRLDGEEKQEWSAIPVVLAGLGKAASLDYNLIDPKAPDDPGSKVNAMVPLVARYWREQAERKGTQLIFADSYRPISTAYVESFDGGGSAASLEADDGKGEESGDGLLDDETEGGDGERNLYHKIKDKLVAAGIPAEEIAVIGDYGSGAKREELFDRVNRGEVRVVIGSTWKMGVGVNVQERLYAIHHLDAPWTPADLDQRNARGERDGNRYAEWGIPIKRHSYAMADTLDAGRFQLLETKGKFARQAMEGKMGVEFDDPAGGIVDEAAQMKALAAGNPLVLRQVELENRVRELEIGRQAWMRTRGERADLLADARKDVVFAEATLKRTRMDADELESAARANPIADPAALAAEIDSRIKVAAKAVTEDGALALSSPAREVFVRNLRGLRVSVTVRTHVEEVSEGGERKQRFGWRASALVHRGTEALRSAEVKSGGGKRVVQLLDDVLSDARSQVDAAQALVDRRQARLAELQRESGSDTFELQDDLDRATRALAAVNRAVQAGERELRPDERVLLSSPGQLFLDFEAPPAAAATPEPVNRARLVKDNLDLADSIARHWRVRGVEPEDLQQDARVALVRAAQGYDPSRGNFRSYAGVAVRNALRDKYAQGKRRAATDADESLDEVVGDGIPREELIGTPETTRDEVARRESAELLDRAVEGLPERPRRLVRHFMEGMTLRDIGRQEGVSGEAIRKTLSNAFGVIRARLRKEGVMGLEGGMLYSAPNDADMAEIRRLMDELAANAPTGAMREMQTRVDAERDGERTLGRPDLANPAAGAARNVVNAVDAARAAEAERETQERWREEAQALVARDRSGVLRDVLERSRRGDVLADPVMVKAAQILVADLTAEAVRTRDPQVMRDAQLLAYAYRETGTEQARAMAARHDPHKRPAERHKEFLAGALFSPTPAIRKAMREAWSPAEKSRAVAELERRVAEAEARAAATPAPGKAKVEAEAARLRRELGNALQRKDALEVMNGALDERLKKIEAELGKMGVTLDHVFNGEAYLRLRGAKIIGAVADKAGFDAAKRKALKLIQNGWNNAEVAKRTGLTADQVAGVESEMVARLKERLRTLGDAALDVTKFDTDALFSSPGEAEGKGLSAEEREKRIEEIVRAMGFNRGTERETRTRRASARKPRPDADAKPKGPRAPRPAFPPADDATLDEVRATRPRGSQAAFDDPNPRPAPSPELPDTGGPRGELQNDAVERGPGRTPDYPASATGRPDTSGGNRQMVLGEDAELAPPVFDIADPVQVAQLARVIQATDANAFDMAFEFWVNSILSGPLTQGANIVGNAANALWDFGPKRFGEAAINAALGNRPDLPHMAEYRHMMRAVGPALSRAWANALRAWAGEVPVFESDVLDAQMEIGIDDKSGGVPAAIGGKLGRVVRIPGRLLMATDDFFKSSIGHLEATAQAYRIAKAEGLTGESLEARIAGLVNTPGSAAWTAAVDKAKELTFQSDSKVADAIRGVRELEIANTGIRPLRFILPFVRTPMNIFQQGIRQSPLGSVGLALRLARAGLYKIKDGKPVLSSYPAALLAKHAVEQLIAWTVAGLVYASAAGDDDDETKPLLITGAVTGDTAGLRELNERSGLRPYSIRVGNVTVSYGRIEPLATALGTTIDAISGWKRRGAVEDYSLFGALVGGLAQQTQEKTFLRGVGDLMGAVDQSRAGERSNYVANFLASWVPNLIRQPLRQLDPVVRDARGAGFVETLAGRVVPQTLPPKVDVYGEEVQKGGLAAWRATIPVELMRTPEMTRVDRLLTNYAQRHPQEAWAPAPITRRADGRELSGEEKRKLATETGRIASRLLASAPLNVDNPSADDIERVKRAFTVARANAKRRVLGAAP